MGPVEALGPFRSVSGWTGELLTDPSRAVFQAAGLARSAGRTFHPRTFVAGARAFLLGFRQGRRAGDPFQQGGTFVLGPGDAVRYVWRDGFAGDHAPLAAVLAALDARGV